MFKDLTLIGLLGKGGVTVIVLLLFSLVSIAIMLERFFAFRAFENSLERGYALLKRAVEEGGMRGAEKGAEAAQREPAPVTNVFLSGYSNIGKGKDEVMRAMELQGRAEIASLERSLGILGTIGSTAPFIGLFGTVVGIIRAFSDLAVAGGGGVGGAGGAGAGVGPAAVADGIAEALVATAAGLFVAIPAVIAYNYFIRRSSACALLLERKSSEFVHILTKGEGAERGEGGEGHGLEL